MLCLKLLEMHGSRDITVAIFLSYFIVITGFLFTQSIFIGAYMFIVVLMLTTTLIAFNHLNIDPAQQRHTQIQIQTQHLKLALKLLFQALPLTILLFVLFPRIPGPLWGLPEDVLSAKTGLSDSMQPGRISQLVNNHAVAFRVLFKGQPPPNNQRYWRGPVLTHFDGRRWRADTQTQRLQQTFNYTADGDPFDYTVTLEAHDRHWIFALDLPAILPRDSRLTREFQIISKEPVNDIYRYEMRSYLNYKTTPSRTEDYDSYLTLPASSAPKTRQLVAKLAQTSTSAAEYVEQVQRYFSEQPFFYSRQPPLLFDDPIDEFLFETRKGFCEHYASTFTVMMRLNGIPARVVTGYLGGEMNPLSDYMIVRQSDAHAWSEVWLAGKGWVRVDPTSFIPPERIESTVDLGRIQPETRQTLIMQQDWLARSLRQAGFAWDAVNNRWNQWVVGYNDKRQSTFLSALGIPDISWKGLAIMLFATLTVVLLIISYFLFRRQTPSRDAISDAYQRFNDKLARIGLIRSPNETPLDFAQRVSHAQQQLAEEVHTITALYNRLRYKTVSEEGLEQLKLAVKRFKVGRDMSFTNTETGKNLT